MEGPGGLPEPPFRGFSSVGNRAVREGIIEKSELMAEVKAEFAENKKHNA